MPDVKYTVYVAIMPWWARKLRVVADAVVRWTDRPRRFYYVDTNGAPDMTREKVSNDH